MELVPVPDALASFQAGFGLSIRTPIDFSSGKFRFQIQTYPDEIVAGILPRGDQPGRDRLAIYNEQYWYRLFTTLQQEFPLLVHLIGYWKFNQWAGAYLEACPSTSPFLENLALGFSGWFVKSEVNSSPILDQVVELEVTLLRVFHTAPAQGFKTLDQEPGQGMDGHSRLKFQTGFSLFEEDWGLMDARSKVLRGAVAPQVPIQGKGYLAIYRKADRLEWKCLDATAFRLLQVLLVGMSLGDAIGLLAEELGAGEALDSLPRQLPIWFEEWAALGWFVQNLSAASKPA